MPLAGGDANQLPPSLPEILINIDHFAKVNDRRTFQARNLLIGIPAPRNQTVFKIEHRRRDGCDRL
jgi:hypothetical protein